MYPLYPDAGPQGPIPASETNLSPYIYYKEYENPDLWCPVPLTLGAITPPFYYGNHHIIQGWQGYISYKLVTLHGYAKGGIPTDPTFSYSLLSNYTTSEPAVTTTADPPEIWTGLDAISENYPYWPMILNFSGTDSLYYDNMFSWYRELIPEGHRWAGYYLYHITQRKATIQAAWYVRPPKPTPKTSIIPVATGATLLLVMATLLGAGPLFSLNAAGNLGTQNGASGGSGKPPDTTEK